MQPHIIRLPPPNLTVPLTCCSVSLPLRPFHTHSSPSDPTRLTFVSSDQTTRFQSSVVQCWYRKVKLPRWRICFAESRGFFFLCAALRPASCKARRTVWGLHFTLVI